MDNQTNNNQNTEKSRSEKAFQFLDLFGELFVLNFIFILFSIPVVTISSSWSAMYAVSFKLINGTEGSLWNSFVGAFKKNFKQTFIMNFILVFYLLVLFAQYYLIISCAGIIRYIYIVFVFTTLAIGALVIPFLYPLITRYNNTIVLAMKNAFLLSLSHLGTCIKVLCVLFAPIALSIIYPKLFLFTWFLWLTIIFAGMNYISARMVQKVFNELEQDNTDNAGNQ